MWNTAIPFMAATTALLLGWIKWRQAPRGANGLLFQYGVLAAGNVWILTLRTDDGWLVALGVLPLMMLWTAPAMLRHMVEVQYRIGRPGPVGWMLMLRAVIAWHRRHLVDYVFDPVRRLLIMRRNDEALELAERLQSLWVLRGMEAEAAEWVVQALYRAKRWDALLADPAFAQHAKVNPALRVYLLRARMEAGDVAGAAEELRAAAQEGMPGVTLAAFWADLLRILGRDTELEAWLERSGLNGRAQLKAGFDVMLEKTRQAPRNDEVVLPEPPLEVIDEQNRAEELEVRMRQKGPLSTGLTACILVFWIAQWSLGAAADSGKAIAWGALAPAWLEGGQWWRALTMTWLHGSWLHVTLNALNTLVVVPFGVAFFGKRLTLLVWVVSAVAGAVASLGMTAELAVGASGAVMGIVGLVLGLLCRRPPEIPAKMRNFYLALLSVLVGLVFVYGLVVESRVDNGGHLGGMVAGVLLGLVLPPVGLRLKPIPTPWLLAASAAPVLLFIATIIGGISAAVGGYLPSPVPHQQIPLGARQLAVPAWWKYDGDGGWDCEAASLDFDAVEVPAAMAAAPFEYLAEHQLMVDRVLPSTVGLRRPVVQHPETGVERQILDLWQGRGRWVVWVTRRGGRTVVMRIVAPAGSYALYADYLDELAARATPPE